jgi:hypothetical protein
MNGKKIAIVASRRSDFLSGATHYPKVDGF